MAGTIAAMQRFEKVFATSANRKVLSKFPLS